MIFRISTTCAALVAGLAIAGTACLPANADPARVRPTHRSSPSSQPTRPLPAPCYSQPDNDTGVGIASQQVVGGPPGYNSRGADDFTGCGTVSRVDVWGQYFNGPGPCVSVRVQIFKNNAALLPGASVYNAGGLAYFDPGPGNTGVFQITLPSAAVLNPTKTYWLSVVCRMSFSAGGEWGWNTNNTVRISGAVWKNPAGGFGLGCTAWTALTTCFSSSSGGDFAFELQP